MVTQRTHTTPAKKPPLRIIRRHDAYVRFGLGHLALAIAFWRKHLPRLVVCLIDWKTLRPYKPDLINTTLKGRIADAVFIADLKSGNGEALLCLEHLSSARRDVPTRLGSDLLQLAEAYHKAHKGKKSLMTYGLLLYNGPGPYGHSTDLFASLNKQEQGVARESLGSMHVVDTHAIKVACPNDDPMLTVFELALKHVFDPKLEETLATLWPYVQALEQGNEADRHAFSDATVRYVTCLGPEQDLRDILELIKERLGTTAGEKIMTLGLALKREGRQEGRQEGGVSKALEIARNMLREGMTATTIAKVTGLPRKQLATLLKK